MSKNMVQHQHGYSFLDLFKNYGTEKQCIDALFKWKWPSGYICSECGSKSYCPLKSRKTYQCNHCHHQKSVTTNTIFEYTKLPLTAWFLSVHLISQAKTGISALVLQREVGVSYNTGCKIKQQIMHVRKERDGERQLSGIVCKLMMHIMMANVTEGREAEAQIIKFLLLRLYRQMMKTIPST